MLIPHPPRTAAGTSPPSAPPPSTSSPTRGLQWPLQLHLQQAPLQLFDLLS